MSDWKVRVPDMSDEWRDVPPPLYDGDAALAAIDIAEDFVRTMPDNWESEEWDVEVMDPTGKAWNVAVTIEYEPTFCGSIVEGEGCAT